MPLPRITKHVRSVVKRFLFQVQENMLTRECLAGDVGPGEFSIVGIRVLEKDDNKNPGLSRGIKIRLLGLNLCKEWRNKDAFSIKISRQ